LNSLPSDWKQVTIGDVLASLEDGRTIHQGWSPQCEREPSDDDSEWGVLKTTSVQPGNFQPRHNKRLPATLTPRPLLEVREGDVIVTSAGPRARCGVAALVRKTRPRLMLSGKMYRFRFDEALVVPRFGEAYLLSDAATRAIDEMKTGISDSGLNLTHERFRRLAFPLPSRTEQEQIVASIEEQFSRLDAAEASLERAASINDGLVSSLLAEAVLGRLLHPGHQSESTSGRLPTLPMGWAWLKIGEVGRLDLGRQRAPRYHSGPNMHPYLRVANVFEDRIDPTDVKEMNFDPNDFEKYRLQPGDVLLNEGQSPEWLGRPAIYRGEPPDVCFTNTLIRFRADERVEARFALLVFRHLMRSGRFAKESRITTNIAHLSVGRLKTVEFPLPSLHDQQRTLELAEARLSVAASLHRQTMASVRRAESLRRSILREAFAGRLVSQTGSGS
jgi:type I restriction enzyme S subunit